MGILDFLTNGQPIQAQPYASTQQNALPDWYTNYAMDILSGQQAVANRPFALYQGPRVADLSEAQQLGTQTVQNAAGMSGVAAAQPYLQQASQTVPQALPQYMNPYMDSVVGRIGEVGTRTLREQVLPGIEDQMIRAGQFGGTRQAELTGRAIRDTTEGIAAKQAEALASGYGQAQSAAQADLARQGQLGQQVGALTQQQQQLQAAIGSDALQRVGALQQGQVQKNLDLAAQDFEKQFAYPQEQLGALTTTLANVAPAVPKGVLTQGYGAPGQQQTYAPGALQSGISTVTGIAGAIKALQDAGIGL
jgi:hypothetical protein